MNLKQAVIGWWNKASANTTEVATTEERKRSLITKLNRRYTYRGLLEMDRLIRALMSAESIQNPSRQELYGIYRQVELDDQVTAQQRVALIALQRAPFDLNDSKGQPSEVLHDLLEEPWFADVLRFHLEAEWWGHSLIEFQHAPDGSFERVHLVPRGHVIPEWGLVVQEPGARGGYDFRTNPAGFALLEAGGPEELGVLHKVAIPTIRKRYSDEDWSMYSERFGMPLLDIGTDTRDVKEIQKLERFASEFGRNGYVIRGLNDQIKFEQPTVMGTGHHIYRDRIDYADRQIAKLLNGQTSTSDEKAFVGTAEVHERILNDFSFGRLRRLSYWLNTYFFPFAAANGYPQLAGARIAFAELRQQDREDGRGTATKGNAAKEDKPGAEGIKEEEDPKESVADKAAAGKKKARTIAKLSAEIMTDPALEILGLQAWPVPADSTATRAFAYTRDEMADLMADIRARAAAGFSEHEWSPKVFDAVWPEYSKALTEGLGQPWDALDPKAPGYHQALMLREDAIQLAIGKTTRQIRHYRKVFAARGQVFADAYLDNNLRAGLTAEANHIRASAQASVEFARFRQDAHLFPNLRYATAGDERVRRAHALLDGIIKPVNDPFWDQYFPPNGYGCRCDVIQTLEAEEETDIEVPPGEVPYIFRTNPGSSGHLFPKDGIDRGDGRVPHPYFSETKYAYTQAREDLRAAGRFTSAEVVGPNVTRDLSRLATDTTQSELETEAAIHIAEWRQEPAHMRDDSAQPDGNYDLTLPKSKLKVEIKSPRTAKASAIGSLVEDGFAQGADAIYVTYPPDRDLVDRQMKALFDVLVGRIVEAQTLRGVTGLEVWLRLGTITMRINENGLVK